jgi:hypothetical protein
VANSFLMYRKGANVPNKGGKGCKCGNKSRLLTKYKESEGANDLVTNL